MTDGCILSMHLIRVENKKPERPMNTNNVTCREFAGVGNEIQ